MFAVVGAPINQAGVVIIKIRLQIAVAATSPVADAAPSGKCPPDSATHPDSDARIFIDPSGDAVTVIEVRGELRRVGEIRKGFADRLTTTG
ncbi:MAG: hypothetical protein DME50_03845 [Verrucomicrobia bacterium]|nr:MAG: hypothetical protein DME50_03845 [Verrucomicrobiota bacterium]